MGCAPRERASDLKAGTGQQSTSRKHRGLCAGLERVSEKTGRIQLHLEGAAIHGKEV